MLSPNAYPEIHDKVLELIQDIVSKTQKKKQLRILDAAAGNGYITKKLGN